MSAPEFVIRGQRVLLPDGIAAAAIHVREGRIVALGAFEDVPRGLPLVEVDAEGIILPGLVDTHVHINEPGRTSGRVLRRRRGRGSGRRDDVIEMPLNSIPATTTRGVWRRSVRRG